ncbi:unnamed protein product, partial [Brenthis ino]
MSVREDEDRHKNCPSRNLGLGVAVAAIGVGVGAALYYFMNKRQENPNTAGSTTRDWTCEPDHTFSNESQLRRDEALVLHLLRSDPPRPGGDEPPLHPPLPHKVHLALASGAANVSQLPEISRLMNFALTHRRLKGLAGPVSISSFIEKFD